MCEVVELDADRQERPRRVEEPRRARDERVGPEAEDVGSKKRACSVSVGCAK